MTYSDTNLVSVLKELKLSRRPLIVCGWGVRECSKEVSRLSKATGIPITTTWGARDLLPKSIGSFGTHGVKWANKAIQNADFILTLGTRLDTKATGSPASNFAPKAEIYMVDCDVFELRKMAIIGRPVHSIHSEVSRFVSDLNMLVLSMSVHDLNSSAWVFPDWEKWVEEIKSWKTEITCEVKSGVNPYDFIKELGKNISKEDVIVSDTGCVLGWMMQVYPFKGERFIHAFNNTPMGYGVPAAVGAAFACPDRRVVLVTGDGGLGVNTSEFATIHRHGLNIKTILFNNRGHAMCRQTQRQWLGSEYPATSEEGGLAIPDFKSVVRGYKIPVVESIEWLLRIEGPTFMELEIDSDCEIVGQIKFGESLA